MYRHLKSRAFVIAPLLMLSLGQVDLLLGVPAKTGGAHEIIIDTLDLGGDPTPGYKGGDLNLIHSIGEQGGINRLTGGATELLAGYFGQDLVSPSSITVFSAAAVGDGSVSITWTAPGDDKNVGTLLAGSRFHISSTTLLADATTHAFWSPARRDNAEVRISTGGISPGTVCSTTLTGLQETTYYFRIWTLDQAANWSDISVGATVFALVAPGIVTDLVAASGTRGRTIDLNWTAPGDDGYIGALLAGSRFAIQRSTWSGVVWSTGSVDTVLISTQNINPGSRQRHVLTGLIQGTTYFIAIWTSDEIGNWSVRSATTSAWAQWAVLSVYVLTPSTYNFGVLPTQVSTVAISGIVVRNDGNVNQSYFLRLATGTAPPANTVWTSSSVAGNNQFVLHTIFKNTQPPKASFGASEGNDILTLWNLPSTATNFSDGTHTGTGIEPFVISPLTSDTTMWFKLRTPLATSTTDYQTMPVIITAGETSP